MDEARNRDISILVYISNHLALAISTMYMFWYKIEPKYFDITLNTNLYFGKKGKVRSLIKGDSKIITLLCKSKKP